MIITKTVSDVGLHWDWRDERFDSLQDHSSCPKRSSFLRSSMISSSSSRSHSARRRSRGSLSRRSYWIGPRECGTVAVAGLSGGSGAGVSDLYKQCFHTGNQITEGILTSCSTLLYESLAQILLLIVTHWFRGHGLITCGGNHEI